MEKWLIYTLLSVLFAAITVNLQRYLIGKLKVNINISIFLFNLFAGIFFLGWWLIQGGSWQDLQAIQPYWLYIVLSVILYTLFNIFSFISIEKIESAKFSIILSTSNIFVIVFSALFLGKTLTLIQLVGTAVVFLGIILLNYKLFKNNSLKEILSIGIGEILAFCAAVSLGAAVTNDGFLVTKSSLYLYVGLAFILPALVVAFINKKDFTHFSKINRFFQLKSFLWFLLFCGSYIFQAAFFIML